MGLVSELVFYTLLILLPVNLGAHFLADFSYIHGVLVDYYIPTVYLTDLLVLFLLGTWVVEIVSRLKTGGWEVKSLGQRPIHLWWENSKVLITKLSLYHYIFISLALFLLWSVVSVVFAANPPLALYRFSRFLLYILLALWIGTHVNLKRDFKKIATALLIGVFYESLLAIGQWLKGGSLFGYYFLGEQPYNALTFNVAKTGFLGEVHVRSYGTFPHPNLLGAFFALTLPWLLWRFNQLSRRADLLLIALSLAALLFSFSRAAWLAAVVGILLYYALTRFKSEARALILGGLLSVTLLLFFFYSGAVNDPFSLSRRGELNGLALQMVHASPLTGVGFGNFILRMDDFGAVSGYTRFLQPVHNLFLLVASELGLPGLIFFSAFLMLTTIFILRAVFRPGGNPEAAVIGPASATLQLLIRSNRRSGNSLKIILLINWLQFLFLSLADHYFFTLPQGGLIFALLLGLVFSLLLQLR